MPASNYQKRESVSHMEQPNLSPDLSIRQLNDWAVMQSQRLRSGLSGDSANQTAFVLSQAAKLAEEVGELQAEVLGQAGYQRVTKGRVFDGNSMAGELADVMICVAILAGSHSVDLGKAVAAKIQKIESRHQPSTPATD
jgi:NTP pyrophosphatase (non-canonical NTP hydrolase)